MPGVTYPPAAEYYLNTLFDDGLKKSNKKTYQQMMFDTAELEYNMQHHKLYLTESDQEYAKNFLKRNNLDPRNLIGVNIGASPRWPSKVWHSDNLKEFIVKASEREYKVILFGGPNEVKYHEEISEELNRRGVEIYRNDPFNSDREFVALVDLCNHVVSGDSFALHIALALQKPTSGLFFCTSPEEVETYGLLKKFVSPMLYEFFPEKSDQYSEELTKSISVMDVLESLK